MLELRLDPSEEKSILMFGFGKDGKITNVLSRINMVDDCIEGSYAVDMSSMGHGLSGGHHCNIHAVSYQHALEISIKATDRWLAHQFLMDPLVPPSGYPGPHVLLWHPEPMTDHPRKGQYQYYLKLEVHQPTWTYSESIGIIRNLGSRDWQVTWLRDRPSETSTETISCATEEEAVSVTIHKAASWISLALIEAFEPKQHQTDEE